MDGTLVDSEHLWLQAEVDVMTSLGARWTAADQAHCLGGPLERVAAYMSERSGGSASAQAVGEVLLDTIESHMRTNALRWRPGAIDVINECLRLDVPRVLVTASWSRLVNALIDRITQEFGQHPFSAVIAGDDVRNSKPHPEPYVMAAAAVGCQPISCLAIEDSPTGVASAIAAGCGVIAVPHLAPVDDVVRGVSNVQVVSSLDGRSLADLWSMLA